MKQGRYPKWSMLCVTDPPERWRYRKLLCAMAAFIKGQPYYGRNETENILIMSLGRRAEV